MYYYKGKSACSWDFQYHLPTSSCQRTLWMTSKFVASSFINHFLQCLRFFENVLVVRLFLSTHIFLEIPYLEKIDKTQIKLPVHLIITKDEQKCTRKSQHAWFIFYRITCLLLISRFLQFFHSDARYLCEIATHLCLCPFKTTIELTCLQLKRIELNGEAQEDIRGGLVYLVALPCRTTRGFLKS